MSDRPTIAHMTQPQSRERQRKQGYSPRPYRSSSRDRASRKRPRPRPRRDSRSPRSRYRYSDASSDYSDYSETTDSGEERYQRDEKRDSYAPRSRGYGEERKYGNDEYGRDESRRFGSDGYEERRERDRYWDRKRPYGYRRHYDRRGEYGSDSRERKTDYRRYDRSSDESSYDSRYDYDRYRDRRRGDRYRDDRYRDDRYRDDRYRDDRYRDERRSVDRDRRDRRDRYPDQRKTRENVRPPDRQNSGDEERPRRSEEYRGEVRDREDERMTKRVYELEKRAETRRIKARPDENGREAEGRPRNSGFRRDRDDIDDGSVGKDLANRGSASNQPPDKEETFWQRRRRIRENTPCSPVWDVSPSPPRRMEDRLEVGADERQKKERKRQRKEERRAKREAKRARKAAKETETNKEPEQPAPSQHAPAQYAEKPPIGPQVTADSDDEEEVVGPALPPSKEKNKLDYGKALRPGEGSKMAAFVQDGARIPRRGEIGLTSDEISKFEDQGYVMSGSRNRRMEAVRIRKENQVYSAEELAALSQFSREERKAREERMLSHFRTLVDAKRKDAEASNPGEESKERPA